MVKNKKKLTKNKSDQARFVFPTHLLAPIGHFLIGEERKILKKIRNLKEEDPFKSLNRGSNNASPDADAEEQFGHMKNAAIQNQLRRRLIQVRKALTRVKIGNYGACEKCAKLIDTDRLIVYPETTTCLTCLEKEEKKKN